MTTNNSSTPVYDLLADEARWCRFGLAKAADGCPVATRSKEAVSWCVVGAVFKCYHPSDRQDVIKRVNRVVQERHECLEVEVFNDAKSTTHAMVLAVLREAGV